MAARFELTMYPTGETLGLRSGVSTTVRGLTGCLGPAEALDASQCRTPAQASIPNASK